MLPLGQHSRSGVELGFVLTVITTFTSLGAYMGPIFMRFEPANALAVASLG